MAYIVPIQMEVFFQQLDPTIQGSETSTVHGLEQTLFDRITLMVITGFFFKFVPFKKLD